ncbi:MAG: hypothetical protein RMN51_05175 [Verrucomicrobiota bacterium]|nr:hypothetical protein [Limisphaera sp.]MDW8381483.1 hypothetical protein [Verrucomicrobiota bacterium]
MRRRFHRFASAGLLWWLMLSPGARGETVIATFDDFFSLDGLFAWADATIVATETNYSITDVCYGSGYKDINVDATGETTVQVTVTLDGPPAADGHLGPIVSLVDADGTFYNYAWYGRTRGRHVLTMDVHRPTFVSGIGSVPGLDLSRLDFFHLQLDPGFFGCGGAYTVIWEDFRLIGAPGPRITRWHLDSTQATLALSWESKPGKLYTILYTANLEEPFAPMTTDIYAEGTEVTWTVPMPASTAGWFRILQQP